MINAEDILKVKVYDNIIEKLILPKTGIIFSINRDPSFGRWRRINHDPVNKKILFLHP